MPRYQFKSTAFLQSGITGELLNANTAKYRLRNAVEAKKLKLAEREVSLKAASLAANIKQNRVANEFRNRQFEAQQIQQDVANTRNEEMMRLSRDKYDLSVLQNEQYEEQREWGRDFNEEKFEQQKLEYGGKIDEMQARQTQQTLINDRYNKAMELQLLEKGAEPYEGLPSTVDSDKLFSYPTSNGEIKQVWLPSAEYAQAQKDKRVLDLEQKSTDIRTKGQMAVNAARSVASQKIPDVNLEWHKVSNRLKLKDIVNVDEFRDVFEGEAATHKTFENLEGKDIFNTLTLSQATAMMGNRDDGWTGISGALESAGLIEPTPKMAKRSRLQNIIQNEIINQLPMASRNMILEQRRQDAEQEASRVGNFNNENSRTKEEYIDFLYSNK